MEKKRVLIVDDTAFMRMMVKDILAKLGISQIFEASTGTEAVKQYKTVRPHLVIMDITMPDMDGVEALKSVLRVDPNAQVIMLSSRSFKKLVVETHQIGAVDFIAKPFQSRHLMETICKHLQAVQQM